jgi:hypothetical protein
MKKLIFAGVASLIIAAPFAASADEVIVKERPNGNTVIKDRDGPPAGDVVIKDRDRPRVEDKTIIKER